MRTQWIILFLLFFLFAGWRVQAQAPDTGQFKYKAWLYPIENDSFFFRKGYLQEVRDSSVVFLHSTNGLLLPVEYQASEIRELRFQKKGKVLLGGLTGGLLGIVAGVLIAEIQGDDEPCGYVQDGIFAGHQKICLSLKKRQKVLLYGSGLGLMGFTTGYVISSFKIKILLKGSFKRFQQEKSTLKKHL